VLLLITGKSVLNQFISPQELQEPSSSNSSAVTLLNVKMLNRGAMASSTLPANDKKQGSRKQGGGDEAHHTFLVGGPKCLWAPYLLTMVSNKHKVKLYYFSYACTKNNLRYFMTFCGL
jgi:hypothetical protein